MERVLMLAITCVTVLFVSITCMVHLDKVQYTENGYCQEQLQATTMLRWTKCK